jgi:hypothetical protein
LTVSKFITLPAGVVKFCKLGDNSMFALAKEFALWLRGHGPFLKAASTVLVGDAPIFCGLTKVRETPRGAEA